MKSISDKTKTKLLGAAEFIGVILLWFFIWEICAKFVPYDFVLPSPVATLKAFFTLTSTSAFWETVLLSLFRILVGLLIGTATGILLGFAAKFLPFFRKLYSPFMTVIRSTPVASFIILLWMMIGGANVPTAVSVLMVTPLIWQTVIGGLDAAPKDLLEVSKIFRFTPLVSFRYIYFPTLLRAFLPAFVNAIGLAWKAGVAAEVIVYLRNSIGQNISAAKADLNGEMLFAWTLTVILLSLLLEGGTKYLCGRFLKKYAETH